VVSRDADQFKTRGGFLKVARWRVYVNPFDDDGAYTEYVEVTSDVAALGSPKQGIDNTEFDVGVVKNSGFNITLRNDHGYYSDVTELQSIFRYTRKNAKIKITWDIRDYDLIAGFFSAGQEPLGGEYLVFEGLINEVTSTSDIAAQQATFSILGFDSLLNEIQVPYSSISNGQDFSTILYAMLNQAPFTSHITVSLANINPSTELAIDDKTSLENKTVGGVLKNILLAANSVLYIKSNTVYVVSRTPDGTVEKTFYGQASRSIENIINIPKFRDGLNRVFNLWTWDEVESVYSRDTSSITKYGVLAKSIRLDIIADASTSKIQTILDANKTEFAFPKVELELETPIWYDTLALDILDTVNIDYPTIYHGYEGAELARYDLGAVYDGTARYPHQQWSLTLSTETDFKITSKKIDPKKQTILFGLREV
jgi:hypothetical protein